MNSALFVWFLRILKRRVWNNYELKKWNKKITEEIKQKMEETLEIDKK